MQRRKSLREAIDDHWTMQQLVAVVLQLIEVAAIVAIAWVALFGAREMKRSQSEIIEAIRSLHTEVQRTDGLK